jgi:hypothetical protein
MAEQAGLENSLSPAPGRLGGRLVALGLVGLLGAAGWLAVSAGSESAAGMVQNRAAQGARLEVSLRGPLHAAAYLAYRREPIGEALLRNAGRAPLAGGRLEVTAPGRDAGILGEDWVLPVGPLRGGAESRVELLAPFGEGILGEPSGELLLSFLWRSPGGEVRATVRRSVPILEVGHLTWEDPELLAVYVQPHQEDIARLGGLAARRAVRQGATVVPALGVAASTYEALKHLDIRYLRDPVAPCADALAGRVVDRVRPPSRTLAEGSGDCDDLAVLLASALEAASLSTAFAVGEGHVLPLVDCGSASGDAGVLQLLGETLVRPVGGRLWAPLEATVLGHGGGFLEAWAAGSERGGLVGSGAFRLVVTREAWERFPPPPAGRGAVLPAVRSGGAPDGGSGRESSRELGRLRAFLESRAVRRVNAAVAAAAGAAGNLSPLERAQVAAATYAELGFHDRAARGLERALASSGPGAASEDARLLLEAIRAERAPRLGAP